MKTAYREPRGGYLTDEKIQHQIRRIKNLTGCEDYYNANRLYCEFLHWRNSVIWQQRKSGCDICEPSYAEFCLEMENNAPDEFEHLTRCPEGHCKHTPTREQAEKNFRAIHAAVRNFASAI